LALGVLFEMVRAANRFLAETKEYTSLSLSMIAHVRHLFVETGSVLGLFTVLPSVWLENIKSAKADRVDISPEEIDRLIVERTESRAAKNFKRGDEIRDLLLAKGILLFDSPQATTWKVK
jgi:cysteinyl-tRNA synthetase